LPATCSEHCEIRIHWFFDKFEPTKPLNTLTFMQINYGENEIKALLVKLRIFNRDIGNYQAFAISDSFDYPTKLDNGTILIKLEDLQDDERGVLTPAQLTAISNRFKSSIQAASEAQPIVEPVKMEEKKEVHSTQPPHREAKKSSFFKTLLQIAVVVILIFGSIALYEKYFLAPDDIILEETLDETATTETATNRAPQTYEERIESVEEIEKKNPVKFLSADGSYRENFWGDKLKVSCAITNYATVASYKDVVVRVTYYTKTKTVLASEDHIIYEVIPPNKTKTVQLKIVNYKNTHTIGWDVVSAKNYN
jgi:uncharacterized protein YxeA